MITKEELEKEIEELYKKILASSASKKLIIAGPGTGKTTLFKKLISSMQGGKDKFLALTFINNLEDELKKELGEISNVYTLHGYCHFLIISNSELAYGLKEKFFYYPPIVEIIKRDWEILTGDKSPQFYDLMRKLEESKLTLSFVRRGNYYNAVGFDDSVFRVYKGLGDRHHNLSHNLIVIDEYQDFNLLETSALSKIIGGSPVLIVGDDDQALYTLLTVFCNFFGRKTLLNQSRRSYARSIFKCEGYTVT